MNRENLLKLAEGLEGPLRAEFSMWMYSPHEPDEENEVTTCGTAGCAIGHATYLVEPKRHGESFSAYSYRLFDLDYEPWQWCFDCLWGRTDNTPKGAAARIRWLLNHGLPDNWEDQKRRRAPLCYAPEPTP